MCKSLTVQDELVRAVRSRPRGCLSEVDLLAQIARLLRSRGYTVQLAKEADLLRLPADQAQLALDKLPLLDLRVDSSAALQLLARRHDA